MSFTTQVAYHGVLMSSFPTENETLQHLDNTGLVSHIPVNKTLKIFAEFLFIKWCISEIPSFLTQKQVFVKQEVEEATLVLTGLGDY